MRTETTKLALGIAMALAGIALWSSPLAAHPAAAPASSGKCWGKSTVTGNGADCGTCEYTVNGSATHDPTCEAGCSYSVIYAFDCESESSSGSRHGTLACDSEKSPDVRCPENGEIQVSQGKLQCSACLENNPW